MSKNLGLLHIYTYVNQNIYNSKPHHPLPPYLIKITSYTSYDSKRCLCVDLGGQVTGTVMAGMAQPARSLHHQWGMTNPSSLNEHHEEEFEMWTSSVAGDASSATSEMKCWNCVPRSMVPTVRGQSESRLPHLVPAINSQLK